MKKVLCLVCVLALGLVACSKNKKDDSATAYNSAYNSSDVTTNYDTHTKSAKDAKYQIIDQEFDNMLASATDYDAIPAHELQACDDSYLPLVEPDCCGKGKAAVAAKGKAKAKATATSVATTRAKKVTNTTNIYYVDGNQTVPVSSTSTTKTVYRNGTAVSSSSSSTTDPVTKTTTNADGSVTTTTTYSH